MGFDIRLNLLKAPKRAAKFILAFDEDLRLGEPWTALYEDKLIWRPWPECSFLQEQRVVMTLIYAYWQPMRARVGNLQNEFVKWNVLDLEALIYVAEGQGHRVPNLRSSARAEAFTRKGRKWLPLWQREVMLDE